MCAVVVVILLSNGKINFHRYESPKFPIISHKFHIANETIPWKFDEPKKMPINFVPLIQYAYKFVCLCIYRTVQMRQQQMEARCTMKTAEMVIMAIA